MITSFKNEEKAYLQWLDANRHGYVFNHFGIVPDMNILHRSNCRTLTNAKDAGSRTVSEKICSPGKITLEQHVARMHGQNWRRCRVCMP